MHGHSIKEVDPFACHINKSFVGRAKKGEVFPYRHYGKKKFGWNFWTSTKKKSIQREIQPVLRKGK